MGFDGGRKHRGLPGSWTTACGDRSLPPSLALWARRRCRPSLRGLFALWVCLVGVSSAADQQMHFRRFGVDDGLSQSTVNVVLRDRRGFVWAGTQDGLNRFDGHSFTLYGASEGGRAPVRGRNVSALIEAADGSLWIGTRDGGLSHLHPYAGRVEHFRTAAGGGARLRSDEVLALALGTRGRLWVGSAAGLDLYDPSVGTFRPIRLSVTADEDPPVTLLHADGYGRVWAASPIGLQLIDAQDRVRTIALPGLAQAGTITALVSESETRLLLGTSRAGLMRLQLSGSTAQAHTLERLDMLEDRRAQLHVTAILPDRDGRLWVGTRGEGLFVREADAGRWRRLRNNPGDPLSLDQNTVLSLQQDGTGLVWIGTFGGFNLFDPRSLAFGHYRHDPADPGSLSNDWVRGFVEDPQGRLWVATLDGLNRWDPQQRRFAQVHSDHQPHSAPGDDEIWSLALDGESGLWLGRRYGLGRYDFARNALVEPALPDAVRRLLAGVRIIVILAEPDGGLWLGSREQGLIHVRGDGSVRHYQTGPKGSGALSHAFVRSLLRSRRGDLWVGTWGGGLCRLDQVSDRFACFRADTAATDGLNSDAVLSIHEDAGGRLWLATQGGGLNHFDPDTGRARHITVADGLSNDALYGILEDSQGRLWLSSNGGLSRFDPRTGAIRNFSVRDGLQNNEFNSGAYYRSRAGELLFGGISGFNRFLPESVDAPRPPPPLAFTELLLFNRPVGYFSDMGGFTLPAPIEALARLDIGHRESLVSVEFAALDFGDPRRTRYAYRLQGYDRDWIETDYRSRRATYTNLPAGEYRLQVRAVSAAGVASAEGIELPIRVSPPPWRSATAYSIYALVLATAGVLGWRFRQRRLRDRAAIELLRREREQERLLVREKLLTASQITGGLAHEINNPLNFSSLATQNLQVLHRQFGEFLRELAGPDADAEVLDAFARRLQALGEQTDNILDANGRIAAIVGDLRTVSHVDSDDASEVRLAELVRATVRLAGARYRRSIDFQLDLDDDPPVRGYPARLSQVFMNLTVNACQAIEARIQRGEPGYRGCLRVRSVRSGGELQVRFEDNGDGMQEAVRARIFDAFYTTKPAGVGTGLGLPVSLGIVRDHGGRIEVESEPGRGSTFTVVLPTCEEGG